MIRKIMTTYWTVFLCLAPGYAHAYRLGNIEITPRAKVTQTYDSNITYTKDNVKKDWKTALGFGFDAIYDAKTIIISGSANVRREIFNKNNNFNNTSEDFTISSQSEFSKYDRLSLTDSFVHAEEPRSFEDQFGRMSGRYSYLRNTFGGTYTRDLTKQLSAILRYGNTIDNYSRKDFVDSYMNNVGAQLDYAISSKVILLGAYDFYRRDFDNGPHARINTPAVGARYFFTSQLYADGMAGVNFTRSYSGKGQTKPMFSASITNEFDKNSAAKLSFTKSNSAVSYAEDIFSSWRVSGSMNRQLLERLGGSASVFYGEGKYSGSDVNDELKGASGGLTYDIRENIKANVNYNFSRRDSNVRTREYIKHVGTLGITVEF